MALPGGINPASLPLRDIHQPPPVGWWPPAPGWWLLAALVAILLVALALCRRHRRLTRKRRLALRELEQLAALDPPDLAGKLSILLRRAALCHYAPEECAGLCGEKWLAFLDRPFPDQPFSQGPGRCLVDAPYRPRADLDKLAVIGLCRRWLRKLPLGQRRAP